MLPIGRVPVGSGHIIGHSGIVPQIPLPIVHGDICESSACLCYLILEWEDWLILIIGTRWVGDLSARRIICLISRMIATQGATVITIGHQDSIGLPALARRITADVMLIIRIIDPGAQACLVVFVRPNQSSQ